MTEQAEQKLQEQLQKLQEKYRAMGQDLSSYLDGLLYANYLPYWDYIHLDTLLSLQTPKTDFPDEMVFIGYHQITELYFKMILWELKQLTETQPTKELLGERLKRLSSYWKNLIQSFEVMNEGMEPAQFLKFRMSLLPASGFQSVQYRLIEFASTDLHNLLGVDKRTELENEHNIETLLENLYWKKGATELGTGNKTLTLLQFEKKYAAKLLRNAKEYKEKNLLQRVKALQLDKLSDKGLVDRLLEYDKLVNVEWPLVHLKAAAKYLDKKPEVIAATGGTNWQKYLPPNIQQRKFFPEFWPKQTE